MELHVIDLSNWLHRAYHAHIAQNADDGVTAAAIGAAKTFFSMVEALNRTLDKKAILVFAVDTWREDTWRYLLVEEWVKSAGAGAESLYKAGRDREPAKVAALRKQNDICTQVLSYLGYKLIASPNNEADDVMGTLAARFHKVCPVYLHTRDKDIAQLLDFPHVTICHPSNVYLRTEKDCVEHYGVKPNQIVEYLALIGDSADNICGVPGIGPKKAVEILSQHGTLAEFLASGDTKRFKAFRENTLPMSLELMTRLIRLNLRAPKTPRNINELKRKRPSESDIKMLVKIKKLCKFNHLFGV